MRYRFHLDNFMIYVDIDKEKRIVNRIEVEGEQPLLVADTRHRSATLWMLTDNQLDEWGFDADYYDVEEHNGESHTWKWHDEVGNVMLRVAVYSPRDNDVEDVAQVVVAVGEGGQTTRCLLTFMTDFAGWTLMETYGDVETALTEYGRSLVNEKEEETGAKAPTPKD